MTCFVGEIGNIVAPYLALDPLILTDSFSIDGSFGTNLHNLLENRLDSLEPIPGVEIEAEVFVFGPAGDSSNNRTERREGGSIGIDLLISFNGTPVLGTDLKTGAPGS